MFPRDYNVPLVLKTKARTVSTVFKYHSSLETAGKLTKPVLDSSHPCYVVRHIALFLSRDAASRSQRVFEL